MKALLLELSDEQFEALQGGKVLGAKASKKAKTDEPISRDELQAAFDALVDASSKKDAKAALKEKGFKSVKAVDEDQEVIDDVTTHLIDVLSELSDSDVEETPEAAQKLYQDYIEANNKKAGKKILEEYGIKNAKSISSLDADDLSDLIDELTDLIDG